MRNPIAVALLLAVFAAPPLAALHGAPDEGAFGPVDFREVPRAIAKEPAYVGKPLYALFLFGPKGDVRMWAVLDRSKADLAYRDVLYLDRNANGDLTDPGERYVGRYDERGARAGVSMRIRVGDLPVPGTDRVHTEVSVSTVPKKGRKGIWFRMKWCGRETVSGGAPSGGYDSTIWAETAAAAPILRPTAEGPLSFAIWGGVALRIGAANRISLMAGNPGSGPDTLCYVDDSFLDPERDRIVAVLHAQTKSGTPLEIPLDMQAPC